jgi:hypothetical protein
MDKHKIEQLTDLLDYVNTHCSEFVYDIYAREKLNKCYEILKNDQT